MRIKYQFIFSEPLIHDIDDIIHKTKKIVDMLLSPNLDYYDAVYTHLPEV